MFDWVEFIALVAWIVFVCLLLIVGIIRICVYGFKKEFGGSWHLKHYYHWKMLVLYVSVAIITYSYLYIKSMFC